MSKETKQLGALALGLLSLMIVLALTFVVGGQFEKTVCENIDEGYYTGGDCQVSSTNTTASESDAFSTVGDVISAIKLVVSFLTIIVLILIVKMLVMGAKSIQTE